ncbi:cora-domain-containing protein [Hortaea werneckii]|nr:cora-domain-containing protein [Hortaea werneckii]KAI7323906.1 cora-domain-containing protein [Hortaea werneckii]
MNNLYLSAASNVEWLEAVIAPLLERDGFIRTLWHIFRQVRDAGGGSHIAAGIFRSDYMLHLPDTSSEGTASLKQVEMNTFSCAGACHAEAVVNMHRHLAKVADASKPIGKKSLPSLVEATESTDGIVRTLQAAHEAYKTPPTDRQTCILMVVQPWNFNVADERPIEYGLWAADVPCYRCEWPDVLSSTRLLDDGMLLYTPTTLSEVEMEVSCVYYRAGYDEAEYLTDAGRQTRLRLEMSKAIKCPDVLGHLAGTKRVQQALAEPGNVQEFLPQEQAKDVQAVFMSMRNLDTLASELEARGKALDKDTVRDQVLKPNLEGGGHNFYGTKILDHLHRIPRREWSKFTIMQRIAPPPNVNGFLLLEGGVYQGPVVSELGVLGGVVWGAGASGKLEVMRNEIIGFSFKTKPKGVNQLNVPVALPPIPTRYPDTDASTPSLLDRESIQNVDGTCILEPDMSGDHSHVALDAISHPESFSLHAAFVFAFALVITCVFHREPQAQAAAAILSLLLHLPRFLDDSVGLGGRKIKPSNELKLRCTEFDENGNVTLVNGEFRKSELIAKYSLLPRDLRKIDSSVLPHILVRPSAILINLLHLKCLIKHNRVLVFDVYGSTDSYAQSLFMYDLEGKLRTKQASTPAGAVGGNLPYEFRALEAVLITVTQGLESEFEGVREPVVRVLRELEEDIDRDKLRHLLIYSKKLGTFEQKARLVRDAIDDLLEADDDLAAMYLTEKAHDREREEDNHEEVELLLESYHKVADEIVQVSSNLTSAIRNTEEIVRAILDANRNSLMLLEIKFSIATLGISVGMFIAALYGMNLENFIEETNYGFGAVTVVSAVLSWVAWRFGLARLRKVQRLSMWGEGSSANKRERVGQGRGGRGSWRDVEGPRGQPAIAQRGLGQAVEGIKHADRMRAWKETHKTLHDMHKDPTAGPPVLHQRR